MDWLYIKNLCCWAVVHLTHWSLYIGNLVAMIMIIMYTDWYIALPLITAIGHPLIGGMHCAYNNLENRYREKLGWNLIDHNFLPTALKSINNAIRKII